MEYSPYVVGIMAIAICIAIWVALFISNPAYTIVSAVLLAAFSGAC